MVTLKILEMQRNTSSLRKGHVQTMPGKELLEIYKANGGKYVTIGSDAHMNLCINMQMKIL